MRYANKTRKTRSRASPDGYLICLLLRGMLFSDAPLSDANASNSHSSALGFPLALDQHHELALKRSLLRGCN